MGHTCLPSFRPHIRLNRPCKEVSFPRFLCTVGFVCNVIDGGNFNANSQAGFTCKQLLNEYHKKVLVAQESGFDLISTVNEANGANT